MAFPTSPSNNQVHKEGNRAFVYDSALGTWDQVRETDRTERIKSEDIITNTTNGQWGGGQFFQQFYLTTHFDGNKAGADGVSGWTEKSGSTNAYSEAPTKATMWCAGNGEWTFPYTGFWEVCIKWAWNNSNSNSTEVGWVEGMIKSIISGSKTILEYSYHNIDDIESGSDYGTAYGKIYIDVPNTSTHKVGFWTQAPHSMRTQGGVSSTACSFLRLGDT